jgi:hypothetical protein
VWVVWCGVPVGGLVLCGVVWVHERVRE